MGAMLKFLRRRNRAEDESGPVDVEADAAARAEEFWRRWDDMLPEVSAALGDSVPHRVDHQLAELAAAVHPHLTISIERGETAVYALVLTSQADPELRPYTDAWIAAAPAADSLFEYHDSIPPVPDPTEVTVNLRGEKYALADVRVAPQVDEAEGLVDVAVYHPGFAGLEGEARAALTFLPLDAALGERLAADRIGRVETADNEPQGAIGLLEFRDLVRALDDGDSVEREESGEAGEAGEQA
ncbi:hypothetical protein A8924_6526 [Saccharopolyspora erythraea NRRL 2338]|uniref:Uncharacterized protein n=3 Tax=Saccharopolyspora erythraea TaxID=1836 RepID=A4FMS6_SACEN|nr:hypothetical protein N599_33095 [Saccharopolyspora erythraea D]PFG98996.1 hypothetical protein A8924_6526 [Saccharopolyspora erythraea NRRL 2338]CAM05351.1 hypothetical protein SACE_6178 [Saccharopolyspora erythraea NRRL 2338]